MRILGIDPGSRHTGFGLIESVGSRTTLLVHGRFTCKASLALPGRLAFLADETRRLVERWNPDIAVLEKPFQGVNPHSLIVLAQARGALIATLAQGGTAIEEYSPAEVKSAVTGNGRADKSQVTRMVSLLIAVPAAELTPDGADALAVALCYAARRPWLQKALREPAK